MSSGTGSATHHWRQRLGAHILLLTTTGRKSGKRYTTPLLYLADGDDFVVSASNGGADRDPDWWRNLKAESETTVQVGGPPQGCARRSGDGR